MAAANLLQDSYPNPLRDMHGVLRVGNTRVTLESVIFAFQDGASPEEIVDSFPSLELQDVYATIALYLRRKEEVDAYLSAKEAEGEQVRKELAEQYDLHGLREKLLRRKRELGL